MLFRSSKYCNIARATNCSPPTVEEIKKEDWFGGANTLMQLQEIPVTSRRAANGKVLWDSAANICLIRKSFAKLLLSEGQACVQHVQGAGKSSEPWKTKAHRVVIKDNKGEDHRIIAFEVDQITRSVDSVDISGIMEFLPGVKEEDVHRPCGEMDLLVGIQHAGLHPFEIGRAHV